MTTRAVPLPGVHPQGPNHGALCKAGGEEAGVRLELDP